MASDSASRVEMDVVPFRLFNLRFPVLRNFFNIMPAKELFDLHTLKVKPDNLEGRQWLYYTPYSEILNRSFCTTPCDTLIVYMGPGINPEAIRSKMDAECYRCLHLRGHYHWKDVVGFLHTGVKFVRMCGVLDLSQLDMKEFFKSLLDFKIRCTCFFHETHDKNWSEAAIKAWSAVAGTDLPPLEFDDEYYADITRIPNGDTSMEVRVRLNFVELRR
uniref:Protein MAIN-LIKE 1-like n=1 Tax=Panagrellus redivivus TaxID=6233 RepID=A0A7E4WCL7_PANRE